MNNSSLKSILEKMPNDYFIQINNEFDSVLKIGKYDNKYAFLVRGKSNRVKFQSSCFINILLTILDTNEKQLIFVLEKETLLDVFLSLIDDIRQSLEDKDTQNKLDSAYCRWLLWKELFSNGSNELLSENRIQGLLGELLFLEQQMFKYLPMKEAIMAWGGANYNIKDFEFKNLWFEIKTTLNSNNRVRISSIEQLNSKKIGYLVVTDMQKSTPDNTGSVNLNGLVKSILKKINIPELVDVFITKLSNQGYVFLKKYYEYNYILVSRKFYLVNDDFPKLAYNNIPIEIIEAKYMIDILHLGRFIIDESEIFNNER